MEMNIFLFNNEARDNFYKRYILTFQNLINFQFYHPGVIGPAAVRRVDPANKQEHEHVIKIVMTFKMTISQKQRAAMMATAQQVEN